MRTRKISELPVVNSADVEPLYSLDEIIDKLSIAVNWNRENRTGTEQAFELELMHSLAVAVKKGRKEVNVISKDE